MPAFKTDILTNIVLYQGIVTSRQLPNTQFQNICKTTKQPHLDVFLPGIVPYTLSSLNPLNLFDVSYADNIVMLIVLLMMGGDMLKYVHVLLSSASGVSVILSRNRRQ